jgi:hypothetical protein
MRGVPAIPPKHATLIEMLAAATISLLVIGAAMAVRSRLYTGSTGGKG